MIKPTDITVITSITAGKDLLREEQQTGGAKFVAYVETDHQSKVWEQKPAYRRFRSDRRNSRAPKILSHQFCDTEYSIWIDGNIALRIDPLVLVTRELAQSDLAVFTHPDRSCIYDEAEVCIALGLDDPDVIRRQMNTYAGDGYGKGLGLAEANVIIRRHTENVIEFNNAWWSEYCAHSVRDQLSFMYVASKTGLRIKSISPTVFTGHPDFHGAFHLTAQQEPQIS